MTRSRRRSARQWPAHWFVVGTNVATYACGWFGAAWMFVNLETSLELVLLALGMLGIPKGLAVVERVMSSSQGSPSNRSS